ncbi:MAG: hypothetical protein ABIK28_03135, partial [Planctomycetota bacterium]
LSPLDGVEPFQVREGSLYGYGTDFIALKPMFDGDIEVRVRVRITLKDDLGAGPGYYTLFGYGLDDIGGYIASSCLAYVELQSRFGEPYQLEKAIDDLGTILGYESYDSIIKGTENQVSVSFGDNTKTFDFKGRRKGQVFLWVFGEREFYIEEIEVKGNIDTLWLQKSIENVVDQELTKVIS